MNIQKFFIALFTVIASFASEVTFATTSYSDSLVENLDCGRINSDEIYAKIRPDAFAMTYHLPLKNWSFSAGLYDIAACWSLAHSQRLFYYLSRWDENPDADLQKNTFDILEMIRGSSPYANMDDQFVNEWPLQELTVIRQSEKNWDISSPLWGSLLKGFRQDFPNNSRLSRNLKSEIEFYQSRRFHDFIRNLKYIIGDGSRSAEKNIATRNQILQNLEFNKLTLLLLRPKRISQHVVLAKRFELKTNGTVDIWVYDSNSPLKEQVLTFDSNTSEFYAPEIVRGFPEVKDPQAPLGVFIVDEKDRSLIEKTLVKFYKKMCQQ